MRRYWPFALALACLAVGWFSHRPGPAPMRYRTVTVTQTQIEQAKPDTVLRWRDRIVYRTVHAEQVATAPGASVATVAAYCAPSVRTATADTTESPPPDPRLLVDAWRQRGSSLEVWGPLSNGDAWRGSYRVRGDMEARVSGDSLIVRSDRWASAKTWGGRLLWLGAGALIGAVAH